MHIFKQTNKLACDFVLLVQVHTVQFNMPVHPNARRDLTTQGLLDSLIYIVGVHFPNVEVFETMGSLKINHHWGSGDLS